jgi:acetyltransferase
MATSARGSSRDVVFDEACRCNGVLRVRRVADLFRMAHLLTTQPPARGRRLTIVTNAHGPGVLAADRLHASGGQLASLALETVAALREVLPPGWSGQNPIEIGETGNAVQFTRAAGVASRDPGTDALLVLLTPQIGINPVQAAEALRIAVQDRTKPVLACWLWDAANPQSLAIFREADIPVFLSPEAALNAFDDLCRHTENLRYLSDITAALADAREQGSALARPAAVVSQARWNARAELSSAERNRLFSAYDLTVLETRSVCNEDEAVAAAEAMGYPIQLTLAREPWLSEGNEVRLKAGDNHGVRQAVHTLARIAREHFGAKEPLVMTIAPAVAGESSAVAVRGITHPQLGPVLEFGEAGLRGSAPRYPVTILPPLSPLTARELIVHSPALAGLHPRAGDLDALATFLVNFSRLLVEQRGINEITFNPLLVAADRVLVLDALVVFHDPAANEGRLS